eukprot:TRINITY_DN12552_c1_g1_i1.p1 TRINITY_DN12552_c1_g1~~TRINITY_DN12552_c1_g1_i1.p1  ORF type:complete len:810 (+),score=157.08 TRINITY_DN12552_c1_g1_i1:79-2508(+)
MDAPASPRRTQRSQQQVIRRAEEALASPHRRLSFTGSRRRSSDPVWGRVTSAGTEDDWAPASTPMAMRPMLSKAHFLLSPKDGGAARVCFVPTSPVHLRVLRPKAPRRSVPLPMLQPSPPPRPELPRAPPGRARAAQRRRLRGFALQRLAAAARGPDASKQLQGQSRKLHVQLRWSTWYAILDCRAQERRSVAAAAAAVQSAQAGELGAARRGFAELLRGLSHRLRPQMHCAETGQEAQGGLQEQLASIFAETCRDPAAEENGGLELLSALVACVRYPFGQVTDTHGLLQAACVAKNAGVLRLLLSEPNARGTVPLSAVVREACRPRPGRLSLLASVVAAADLIDVAVPFAEHFQAAFDAAASPRRRLPGEDAGGAAELVEAMLTHPCIAVDVARADDQGDTVLRRAAADGAVELIQLIGRHAHRADTDPTVPGADGLTAFGAAMASSQWRAAVALANLPGCPGTYTRAAHKRVVAAAMGEMRFSDPRWREQTLKEGYDRWQLWLQLRGKRAARRRSSTTASAAAPVLPPLQTPDAGPAPAPECLASPVACPMPDQPSGRGARAAWLHAEAARKCAEERRRREGAAQAAAEQEQSRARAEDRALRKEKHDARKSVLARLEDRQQRWEQEEQEAAARRQQQLDALARQQRTRAAERREAEAAFRALEQAAARAARRHAEEEAATQAAQEAAARAAAAAEAAAAQSQRRGRSMEADAARFHPAPTAEVVPAPVIREPDAVDLFAMVHSLVTGGEFEGEVSARIVRGMLEEHFGLSLAHRRDEIKGMIIRTLETIEEARAELDCVSGDVDWV